MLNKIWMKMFNSIDQYPFYEIISSKKLKMCDYNKDQMLQWMQFYHFLNSIRIDILHLIHSFVGLSIPRELEHRIQKQKFIIKSLNMARAIKLLYLLKGLHLKRCERKRESEKSEIIIPKRCSVRCIVLHTMQMPEY